MATVSLTPAVLPVKSSKKHQLRNPSKWVGKRIPKNIQWHGYCIGDYYLCDDCQRLFHVDDLHSLLDPGCDADWKLQRALHIEEAQSFCDDCLGRIEDEADGIDPCWRHRHGYGRKEDCPKCSKGGDPLDIKVNTVVIRHLRYHVWCESGRYYVTALHTGAVRRFETAEALDGFMSALRVHVEARA